MVFNRLADWEMDQRNPRTAGRHRLLSRPAAAVLLAVSTAGFVATTAGINPLCFALSPVALAIVFFYSLTKRFTDYTQLFLGLALAVAPVGAWLAVRGHFAWAAAGARRGGAVVGGGLRPDLRDDGLRVRPDQRPALAGGSPRHPGEPADRAGAARGGVGRAGGLRGERGARVGFTSRGSRCCSALWFTSTPACVTRPGWTWGR